MTVTRTFHQKWILLEKSYLGSLLISTFFNFNKILHYIASHSQLIKYKYIIANFSVCQPEKTIEITKNISNHPNIAPTTLAKKSAIQIGSTKTT